MTTNDQQTATAIPTGKQAPASRPPIPKPKATAKPKAGSRPRASVKTLSKQDRVLTMLGRKEGTSVAAIMKVTGWQPHSVRGFFAGVVRKKLKLNLVSEGTDGKRIYRIAGAKPVSSIRSRRKASK